MIDWVSVAFSALWISGLGLTLAALSFANYWTSQHKQPLRQTLALPAYQSMIYLGMVLFCAGWAGGASALWERLLWVVLALIFAWQVWQTRKINNL